MIDLTRLRVFREVAKRRSFSRAADALSFTQPSISHHVAMLEAELGQTLINRRARPIALTQAGAILLTAADAALGDIERAERDLSSLAEGGSGTVSLGSVVSGLRSVVPSAVAEFRRKFPDVDLALAELPRREITARLRSGAIDIGVLVVPDGGSLPDPGVLKTQLLTEQPLLVALPSAHRLANRRSVRLDSLAQDLWVLPTPERYPEFGEELQRLLDDSGVKPARTLYSSDDVAGSRLVAAGVGVALVPYLGTFRLRGVALVPISPPVLRRLFAVTISDRPSRPAVGLLSALRRAGAALPPPRLG
jgi:DNA-binding transcriptional LysR family regulator